MKKFLLLAASASVIATPAFAQDVSPFAGPYVGVQVGYANLEDEHDDLDYWYDNFQNFRESDSSLIGGIRAGYDAQLGGGFLVGAIGEISLTDLDTVGAVRSDDDTYEIGAKIKHLGSIRGKLGYTSGNLAVYGTAGFAFANIKHHMEDIDGSSEGYDRKGDRSGVAFGLGAALGLNANSNIGFEVNQYDFGSRKHEVIDEDGDGTDYFFRQEDRVRTAVITYSFGF